jgi:hypothetical protein
MKRVGRLLIFLGIAVMLLSSLGSHTYSDRPMAVIVENDPEVYLFEVGQDVHVNVTLNHSTGTFNVYFMNWQQLQSHLFPASRIYPLCKKICMSPLLEFMHYCSQLNQQSCR